MKQSARDLAEAYLADVLTPAEAEDYAGLLSRDDAALRELLTASRREIALRGALRATEGLQVRRPVRKVAPSRAGGLRWAIAAAAAVVLAALLYAASRPAAEPVETPTAKKENRVPGPKPAPNPQPAPETPPAPPAPKEEKPKEDRAAIERDLMEARERAKNNPAPPRQDPAPAPPPEPPRPEPSAPQPAPRPQPTETVVARIDAVTGDVRLHPGGAAAAKSDLHRGQSLETRSRAGLNFSFPDGSTFELGPDALISQIQTDAGKKILLERGTLRGTVAKQAKDQPLLIATPHGEAKVLGTVLRIHVDPDPKKGTKLDVTEGKVELKNLAGKKVTVDSGSTATAAAGVPLVSSFLEMDGWLRNVRNAAGSTGYGELEIADDPLDAGRKCFRLSYPTTLQGLVLPLSTKIPLSEFDGLACEVYIPNDSPKGIVLDSEVADIKNTFSVANQITIKRGSWQPVSFKPNDYKGLNQLDTAVVRVYICEILPGVAADAAPTHTVYLRRVQIKRTPPGK